MKRQQTLMSLAGKNILVIRPKALPQLGPDRFIEQLLAIGAQPLHLPVMRIDPYPVPRLDGPTSGPIEQLKATVMALANYQAVIFISRPAALLGADWIDHYWPQLPVGVQFYAVGDSTRQVLASQGIDAQAPAKTQSSEGLLALPQLQQLQGHKVLIAKGEGGRELLAAELQRRGAQVDELNLYRRSPVDTHKDEIANCLKTGLDGVVIHSAELLQALLQQLPESLYSTLFSLPLLVPSERVAQLAEQQGFRHITTAATATPDDMVSALARCYISG